MEAEYNAKQGEAEKKAAAEGKVWKDLEPLRKPFIEFIETEAENKEKEDIQKTSMGHSDHEAYIYNGRFDNDLLIDSFDEF